MSRSTIVYMLSAALAGSISVTSAAATDIAVLSTIAAHSLMEKIKPEFERATGHRVLLRFDTAAALKHEIDAGANFDAFILTRGVSASLEREGKIPAGGSRPLATVLLGLATRKGRPIKDISSANAFAETILSSDKIAYPSDGASGQAFIRLMHEHGLYDALKDKLVPMAAATEMEAVAGDAATYGVQLVSEIISATGVELVGPFPQQYQSPTELAIGLSRESPDDSAAAEFVRFLVSEKARAAIKASGMAAP